MTKSLCYTLILFSFFCIHKSTCYSQEDKSSKKFSVEVGPGVTFHTDGNIYKRDGIIAIMSVDFLELGFNYKISKMTKLGISVGTNTFTTEQQISDSTGFIETNVLRKYQWATLNLSFHLENSWSMGIKFGTMEPDYGASETLMGLYLEREIFRSKSLYSNLKINYNARATLNNFHINSNQINLVIGLGFNF